MVPLWFFLLWRENSERQKGRRNENYYMCKVGGFCGCGKGSWVEDEDRAMQNALFCSSTFLQTCQLRTVQVRFRVKFARSGSGDGLRQKIVWEGAFKIFRMRRDALAAVVHGHGRPWLCFGVNNKVRCRGFSSYIPFADVTGQEHVHSAVRSHAKLITAFICQCLYISIDFQGGAGSYKCVWENRNLSLSL